jgi:hypothetical protein
LKIKILIISIVLIISIIGFSFYSNDKKSDKPIFHVTLANSSLYKNGIYSNSFLIDQGEFLLKFVPNGDSPKLLTIKLKGKSFNFSENFQLNGTLHQTSISEYYTWNYSGEKKILISEQQQLSIEINPNGNETGPVSVFIDRM